jgi:2-dehydro-3-deoxyphosphogluconate aldolase/(4S)-4-hydroxy-2-oxoglutarate aldolase
MDKEFVKYAIIQQGMLPLFYHANVDVSIAVTRALYKAGVRAIEYTNRGENALSNFSFLKEERNRSMSGLLLGIGTIKSDEAARSFIKLDADFFVSPGIIPSVGLLAEAAKKLWIPGCMTVTEIILAEECGASLVKLFPGNILGPAYVSAVRDLFPRLSFMPTGGVDSSMENLRAWFQAGVSAVGMGSKLISKTLLETNDYSQLEHDTAAVLARIRVIKNE